MDREIFVDSGAWIALSDRRDQYHSQATRLSQHLLQERQTLVTTNLVVAESYISIRRAGGHPPAMRFLEAIRRSSRLVKVYSNVSLETQAEEILQQYSDQDFSFTDAVSFAVMQQREITEVFAFDHHFLTAGFVLKPGSP